MNCNITGKTPRIPRGNDFKILVQLKECVKSDGETSERDVTIKSGTVPTVNVFNYAGTAISGAYTAQVLDGRHAIVISFDNQDEESGLGNGKYGIEVKGKRNEDDSDFRFYLPPGMGFFIVESSPEGYFPSDSIITYTVNGVVGVAQNVSGGGESAEQVQADWNETNTSSKAYIKNKPTIPSVPSWAMQSTKPSYTASEVGALPSDTPIPSKTSDLTNDSGFITSAALVGYEQKLQIVRNPSTTLTAEFGKYYRFGTVDSLVTITLPQVQDNNIYLDGFIVSITMSDAGLDISTQDDIMDVGLSNLEDGKTYELNFVWNGEYWAVTAIELTAYTPQSS